MNDTVLTTQRLRLRHWRDGDDAVIARLHTPTVMRWLQDGDMAPRRPGSPTERMRAMQALHGHCFWIVERLEDGIAIGQCGLKRVDSRGAPDLAGSLEIGWILGETYWGHGYAVEAARASLSHAFTAHDAPCVLAFTVADNRASWRVMERIGMERAAHLDFHDPDFSAALNPAIVYRIDQPQWRAAP